MAPEDGLGPDGASISHLKLGSDGQWEELRMQLDPDGESKAAAAIQGRLRALGVRSAIVETGYLDPDFNAEFAAHYTKAFHRFNRETRRYHFFLDDMGSALGHDDPSEVAGRLQRASDRRRYVGFLIRRPIRDAPIARAILDLAEVSGEEAQLQVRATYEAHLLGATLRVEAFPFTEQDRRMSSCAHVALWTCARHFQARHGAPWLSMPAISEAASAPMDVTSAQSLPAGAQGLHPDNMVRALKAIGRHPFLIVRPPHGERGAGGLPSISFEAVLTRYVESGIPVVLGLSGRGGREGHAVVACGTVRDFRRRSPADGGAADRLDASCLVSDFLIHDDQRGPAVRMPVAQRPDLPGTARAAGGASPRERAYSLRRDVFLMLVPLPDDVHVTAESAELKAWDAFDGYVAAWERVKLGVPLGPSAVQAGDAACAARKAHQMVARTYLIVGWKYKRWVLAASGSCTLRSRIMLRPLPKVLWVTEFGRFADLNMEGARDRRILAHCVVDASTTGRLHPPLLFHGPGLLTVWNQSSRDAEIPQSLYPVPDDGPYVPRWRAAAAPDPNRRSRTGRRKESVARRNAT